MVIIAWFLVAAGCGSSGREQNDEGAARKDVPTPANLQPLEEALLGVAGCEPTHSANDEFIARSCEGHRALRDAVRGERKRDDAPMVDLAAKHLEHEDAAVRVGSTWLLAVPFGVREGGARPLLAAARRERDPRVLSSFVFRLGSIARQHDEVASWLVVEMAGHENPEVRGVVAVQLGGPGAKQIEGAFDTLLALAEDDADPGVRASACQQLGEHDDPRAVPLMAKLTASPEQPPEVYRGCMVGLLSLWAGGPGAERFEPAYRVSLERLQATESWHRWPLVWGRLLGLSPAIFEEHDWFEPAPLIALIAGLVGDRDVTFNVREKAVEALVRLEAPRALLVELHEDYAAADGTDQRVRDALAAAL